jgi:predicted RNA-binding Zn-ribbon protein involved in translation (DUF1610 family)
VPGDGEYECPHCGEDIVVGKSDTESYEVECPHCDERVEVPGDGEYECPHCGEDIVVGDVNSEDLRKPNKRSSPQSKKKPTGPKKFTRETAKTRKEQAQLAAASTAKNSKKSSLVGTLRVLESSGPMLFDLAKKIFGF